MIFLLWYALEFFLNCSASTKITSLFQLSIFMFTVLFIRNQAKLINFFALAASNSSDGLSFRTALKTLPRKWTFNVNRINTFRQKAESRKKFQT